MMYDYIVFIGRFQPFHDGHYKVIEEALKLAKEVIVLVGSADGPRTIKNPFTYEERKAMIKGSFPQVSISWLNDYPLDDSKWIQQVKERVSRRISFGTFIKNNLKGAIIGCSKDESSWYLDVFPNWERIVPNQTPINARDVRSILFDPNGLHGWTDVSFFVPTSTLKLIKPMVDEPWWNEMKKENRFYINHDLMWSNSPYPPTFVTVDVVATTGATNDRVLLVKRKDHPGKDLWALPGGYLDTLKDKSLEAAADRELKEETGISFIKFDGKPEVIYYPGRSIRGNIITHVFSANLGYPPPKPKAGDDAAEAKWVSILDLRTDNMFEDHYHIIRKVLNLA